MSKNKVSEIHISQPTPLVSLSVSLFSLGITDVFTTSLVIVERNEITFKFGFCLPGLKSLDAMFCKDRYLEANNRSDLLFRFLIF